MHKLKEAAQRMVDAFAPHADKCRPCTIEWQNLREALKQEKEYEVVDGVGQGVEIPRGWKYYYIKPKIPLQTKEWAGLTDEEYFRLQMKVKTPMISVQDYIDAMRMVEAKLKEKNGY